jgi:hypothetical protein
MYSRTRLSFHWTVPLTLAYRKIREFCKHAVSVLQRVYKYNSDRDRVRETDWEKYKGKRAWIRTWTRTRTWTISNFF